MIRMDLEMREFLFRPISINQCFKLDLGSGHSSNESVDKSYKNFYIFSSVFLKSLFSKEKSLLAIVRKILDDSSVIIFSMPSRLPLHSLSS